mmetsp:Transcript_19342/g.53808  ORF Transcript_19342/g.53808 Transcript_19342/m.53808 type:complete len:237 (+) Transcript_19342:1477-2187(+)
MMRPMLLHPQPLAASDKVGTQSQDVVDPRLLGSGTVIGIVLHVETDEGLADAVDDGKCVGGGRGDPEILQEGEQSNEEEAAAEPSQGAEFLPASHNFEDFSFDLALEFGVELVFRRVIDELAHALHLLQMLGGVVRMHHLVLHGDIIASEQMHGFTAWMVEVGEVVDDAIDGNLMTLQCFHGRETLALSGLRGILTDDAGRLALPQFVCVRGHGVVRSFVSFFDERVSVLGCSMTV